MGENQLPPHLHTEFQELADSLLCDKYLRHFFKKLDNMTVNNDTTTLNRSFIINPDEASLMPAVARIGYELAMDRLQDGPSTDGFVQPPVKTTRNQFSGLRKTILGIFKTKFPEGIFASKVGSNSLFSTDMATITEARRKIDDSRARSVGFPEMKSLTSFLSSCTATSTSHHLLQHTPTFFVSILKNIPSILDTSPLTTLKSESEPYLAATLLPPFDRQNPSKLERLTEQREHVVSSLTHLLKHTPNTISLYQYTASRNWRSSPITTTFEKKEITRLEKFSKHSQTQPEGLPNNIDLAAPPSGAHPHYVNCFVCPPFARTSKNKTTSTKKPNDKVAFLDPFHGDVNINRLLVKCNLGDVKSHYTKHHNNPIDPSVKAGHGFILPCNICRRHVAEGKQEYTYFMYSCCLEDLKTHYHLLHSDDDNQLKLYNTVRHYIVTENLPIDLKHCDFYFLTRCVICNHNFHSQSALVRHERICLAKVITHSSFFGLRLVQSTFYNEYTKKATEQADNLHLINQAGLFLKRIQNGDPSDTTSDEKPPTTASTTATPTTTKSFTTYLSDTYGQFVIRRSSKTPLTQNTPAKDETPNSTQTNRPVLKQIGNKQQDWTSQPNETRTQETRRPNKTQTQEQRHSAKAFIDDEAVEDNRTTGKRDKKHNNNKNQPKNNEKHTKKAKDAKKKHRKHAKNAENEENVENAKNAENVKNVENAENAENTENAKTKKNMENTHKKKKRLRSKRQKHHHGEGNVNNEEKRKTREEEKMEEEEEEEGAKREEKGGR